MFYILSEINIEIKEIKHEFMLLVHITKTC